MGGRACTGHMSVGSHFGGSSDACANSLGGRRACQEGAEEVEKASLQDQKENGPADALRQTTRGSSFSEGPRRPEGPPRMGSRSRGHPLEERIRTAHGPSCEGACGLKVVLMTAHAAAMAGNLEGPLRRRPLIFMDMWEEATPKTRKGHKRDWDSGGAGFLAMSDEASEWPRENVIGFGPVKKSRGIGRRPDPHSPRNARVGRGGAEAFRPLPTWAGNYGESTSGVTSRHVGPAVDDGRRAYTARRRGSSLAHHQGGGREVQRMESRSLRAERRLERCLRFNRVRQTVAGIERPCRGGGCSRIPQQKRSPGCSGTRGLGIRRSVTL